MRAFYLLTSALGLASALSNPQARSNGRRVRREIRDLNKNEREALFDAMWEMRNLSTEEGQEKYGESFRTWDYLVAKHGVAADDPDGDQGHYGPCFVTFHRALMLEVENILLSIDPTFKALPYWDLTLDAGHGGIYHKNDIDSIFSDRYLGSYTGDEDHDYAVTDGAFAWWPVTQFDEEEFGLIKHIYSGSRQTGLNRRGSNTLRNPYVTRFPKDELSYNHYVMDKTLEGTKEENDLCSSIDTVRDVEHFVSCMDAEARSEDFDGPPSGIYYKDGEKKAVRFLHAQAHIKIGSKKGGLRGDFRDAATSINDPFFIFHHANIDRLFMQWQQSALESDETQFFDAEDVMYNFPKEPPRKSNTHLGFNVYDPCWVLENTISPNFPFYPKDLFGDVADQYRPSGDNGAYTNQDILKHTHPGAGVYTYDTTS